MPGAEAGGENRGARPCRVGGTCTYAPPLGLCRHLPTEWEGPLIQEEVGAGREASPRGDPERPRRSVPVKGSAAGRARKAVRKRVGAGWAGTGQEQAGHHLQRSVCSGAKHVTP